MINIKRNKILITVAIIVVLAFLEYLFLFNSIKRKISEAVSSADVLKHKSEQMAKQIKFQEKQYANKKIILENNVPFAISRITRLGKSFDLEFISTSTGQAQLSRKFNSKMVSITISLVGDYVSFASFCDVLINKEDYVITIDACKMSLLKNDFQKRLRINLKLKLYIQ